MDFISRFSMAILVKIVQFILILGLLFVTAFCQAGLMSNQWFHDLKDYIHMDTIQLLMAFAVVFAIWTFIYLVISGLLNKMNGVLHLILVIIHYGTPLALMIIFSKLY